MNCRSCHTSLTRLLADLGDQPLANTLLRDPLETAPTYPLRVYLCDQCLLVQAVHTVPPATIFQNYPFRSAASPPWLTHCADYVKMITGRFDPQSVLEIGSNDGTLLGLFNVPAVGVDPACTAPRTIRQFFTAELAEDLYPADLVVANNVIGHVPDLDDFIAGLRLVTRNVLTVEIPWLYHLLHRVEYDCIYHEHFSYWSANALITAFARHDLHVFDVEHFPNLHGGTIRYYFGNHPVREPVGEILRFEDDHGLTNPGSELYTGFARLIQERSGDLRHFLTEHTAVGLGAPAKANTLLNTAKITPTLLPYTTDTTPEKQGMYLPGSRIPIYPPTLRRSADHTLVLAWNWWDEITTRYAGSTKFVHPLTLETI